MIFFRTCETAQRVAPLKMKVRRAPTPWNTTEHPCPCFADTRYHSSERGERTAKTKCAVIRSHGMIP
jgi:hypothetical protein